MSVRTRPEAALLSELAERDFYELFVVLRRAEWITEEGSSRHRDRGMLVLSSAGEPLFSTGGAWLGPSASRAFHNGFPDPSPRYAREPPLPSLSSDVGFSGDDDFIEDDGFSGDGLSAEEASSIADVAPTRWFVLSAKTEEEVPALAVASAALRAVIHAQEAGRGREMEWPGMAAPHPSPEWCEKMEKLVRSECAAFDKVDCNGRTDTQREEFQACNDGDGYYSHQYVSYAFAVDWLLCRTG